MTLPFKAAFEPLTASEYNDIITAVNASTARVPLFVKKTANQTVNNTATLGNDLHLTLPVAANATYAMDIAIHYTTNTTANIKFAWVLPAGMGMSYDENVWPVGTSQANLFQLDHTGIIAASGNGSMLRLMGLAVVGATAGPMQLQWAQNTATVVDTSVSANSYIKLDRVI